MKRKKGILFYYGAVFFLVFMTVFVIMHPGEKGPGVLLEKKPEVVVPVGVNLNYPFSNVNNDNSGVYEYVYTTLNREQQSAYRKIVFAIEQHKNAEFQTVEFSDKLLVCEVDLSEYEFDADELVACFWRVLADHPEYFFVSGEVYYYVEESTGEKLIYIMESPECGTKSIRDAVERQLEVILDDIKAEVAEIDQTAEKVRYIDNYIREYFTYASDIEFVPEVSDRTSSIACVLDGRAVCSGFAKINKYLCDCFDIDTIYITGMTPEGYHAWNYIYIEEEDEWYASDITYSDGGVEIFLCGSDILKTHKPLQEGMSENGLGYWLPQLSNNSYVWKKNEMEVPEEEESDGNTEAENAGEEDDSDKEAENTGEEDDSDKEAENTGEEGDVGIESENTGEEKNGKDNEDGFVDETMTEVPETSETEPGMENNDENAGDDECEKGMNDDLQEEEEVSIFEKNTNGKTYLTELGVIVPINQDISSWVEVGPYMKEESSMSQWIGIAVPEDTFFTMNGEAYINGCPADLFYILEAEKSENIDARIANYKEACKYNTSDEGLYFDIANCYGRKGNYEDAFSYYLEAIDRGDMSAVDNLLLLIEEYKSGEEQQEEYLRVLEHVPGDERVINRIN